MSFWKGVKSAFGFGAESDEDDEEYDSSLPTYAAQPRIGSPKPASSRTDRTAIATVDDSAPHDSCDNTDGDDLPGELFDALIAQFNSAQPDFVRQCLSTEAQRTYLYNALSENLRQRLQKACAGGATTSASDETDRLQRRINTLESEVKSVDTLRQDNRKLQLSIERQKRALLDRINDLEAQVAKFHTEKEKFFTEKRTPTDTAIIDSAKARVKELEQCIAERDKAIEELSAVAKERETAISRLNDELSTQESARQQLEVKIKMSDEMINGLRNQAASARNEYEDTCHKQQLALEQIQEQVSAFEQIKARMEAKINELKEALKQEKSRDLEPQIAKLNEENASLRHTIEANLYNQANSEKLLRDEISQLKSQLAQSAEMTPAIEATDNDTSADSNPTPVQRRRRGRSKKVQLDDELDNTEWFSREQSRKDDSDFGYHEPPHRPSNDNAAQLSLF